MFDLHYVAFIFDLITLHLLFFLFFFNDTATTEIYTLSLHDALPISSAASTRRGTRDSCSDSITNGVQQVSTGLDRKSTRLNSSHGYISYAVFCLKKKKKETVLNPH